MAPKSATRKPKAELDHTSSIKGIAASSARASKSASSASSAKRVPVVLPIDWSSNMHHLALRRNVSMDAHANVLASMLVSAFYRRLLAMRDAADQPARIDNQVRVPGMKFNRQKNQRKQVLKHDSSVLHRAAVVLACKHFPAEITHAVLHGQEKAMKRFKHSKGKHASAEKSADADA